MNNELGIKGFKMGVFLILTSLFLIPNLTPLHAQSFTTLVPGAGGGEVSENPFAGTNGVQTEADKYKTGDYTICDFLRLLANALQIMFEIAAGAALLLFLWACFGMIMNWGNSEKAQKAFGSLKNIFYGLAIMLGAWFLVNAIIVSVVSGPPGSSQQGWNDKGEALIFGTPWNHLEEICEDL